METAVKYLTLNDEVAVMSAKGKPIKKSGENNSVDGSVVKDCLSTPTSISDAVVCQCVSSDEKEGIGKVICEEPGTTDDKAIVDMTKDDSEKDPASRGSGCKESDVMENKSEGLKASLYDYNKQLKDITGAGKPKPTFSEPGMTNEKVIVDLTKGDTEKDPRPRGCEESDVRENTAAMLLQNKSESLKASLYDNTKQLKDVTGTGKLKPAKNTSKLSEINRKKKGKTLNKKVRGVQDQEIPEKKQTSLTDHFQVRRSERKLKTLGEEEAKMALQKQILSEVEDGLEIKVNDEKGRGIFASREFTRGCFVCEYAGELINFQEAKDRESEYEKSPDIGSYMYFFQFRNCKYCVDATKETNRLGRLVNHSKANSNVHTKVFPINDIPRLILVASRDIKIGEELLYDYGDRSKKSAEHHPWLKT